MPFAVQGCFFEDLLCLMPLFNNLLVSKMVCSRFCSQNCCFNVYPFLIRICFQWFLFQWGFVSMILRFNGFLFQGFLVRWFSFQWLFYVVRAICSQSVVQCFCSVDVWKYCRFNDFLQRLVSRMCSSMYSRNLCAMLIKMFLRLSKDCVSMVRGLNICVSMICYSCFVQWCIFVLVCLCSSMFSKGCFQYLF